MMKRLIVSANDKKDAEKLLQSGADEVILAVGGMSFTALRKTAAEEIPAGIPVSLLVNKLFFPEEMGTAEGFFASLSAQRAEALYFADPAMLVYARRAGIADKMIFHPGTLITSAEEAKWWLGQGIRSVVISPLLTMDELLHIARQVPQAEVIIHGRNILSVSRRRLLSAYMDRDMEQKEGLYLVEEKRDGKMPVWEDEEGTQIFSDQIQQSFTYLQRMQEAGFSRFQIDGTMTDTEELCTAVSLYRKILDGADGEACAEAFYAQYGKERYGVGYYEEKTIL